MSPSVPRSTRLRALLRDDSGMSTVEYAIGTLAAAAFAASSPDIRSVTSRARTCCRLWT